MNEPLRIDVFSDVICPWCLIGNNRLNQALAQLDDVEIDLHWLPFELNPDMPKGGMDRRDYLTRKFGADGADEVYGRISRVFDEEGLEADLGEITRTPSTFDAHRLIRHADNQELGTRLKLELFDRYFRRGEDIGDHAVLRTA